MDESDEDVDPMMGPVADLMTKHNLSSTANIESSTNTQNPVEFAEIVDEKIPVYDYLSYFNIHLLFKDIFNYILDIQWSNYMHRIFPKTEQEIFLNHSQIYSSLKKLALFFVVSKPLLKLFQKNIEKNERGKTFRNREKEEVRSL